MLKIKKTKNNEIHIKIGQSKHLLDKNFLLAFGTALGLHLLAVFLFHVHLFSSGEIETILPPTIAVAHYVKSSPDESDAIVSAQINMDGRLTPAQLAPSESCPSLIPLPPHSMFISFHHSLECGKNLFTEIEKEQKNDLLLTDLPIISPRIKIAVSGPLAEIPFENSFSPEIAKEFELEKFLNKNLYQESLTYTIEVDMQSGKVFWFQTQEPSLHPTHNILAEKILKEITFRLKENQGFIQNGHIEILFTSSTT